MKNFITLIVILVAAAFGFKFYSEYKLEKQIDKAVAYASMFMNISYDGVSIKPDASISINNLRFRQPGSYDDVSVGEINFYSSNNWLFLTKFYEKTEDKLAQYIIKEPDEMRLIVKDLSFDLDNEMMEWANAIAYGCEDLYDVGETHLADVGVDSMTFDFTLSADLTKREKSELSGEIYIHDVANLDIFAEVDYSNYNPQMAMTGEIPEPKTITLGMSQDESLSERTVAYCAEKLNMSPQDYLNNVVASIGYFNDVQFVPDEKMIAGMKSMFQGGRLEIDLTPTVKFEKLSQLRFYKPQDRVKMAGLEMRVDGEPLNNLVLNLNHPDFAEPGSPASKQNKRKRFGKDSELAEVEVSEPGFHNFSLADAKKFVGSRIKVTRKSADPMEGKLLAVENGTIKVQQRRYGGNVTFPISSKDISSLEAYY